MATSLSYHREWRRNTLLSRQAVRLPADFGKRKKYSSGHLFPERSWCGAWGFPPLRRPDPVSESETAAPWIILGRGSTRRHARLRGISRRSEAVCTPSRACQLLPGPGHRPAPATRNTLLPTSEATSAGVRFLGEEGARESQGGALPAKAGRPCCPLLCLLGVSHSLHLPPSTGTPGICPIPGPIPPPLAPQGSRVAGPSFCE